MRLLEQHNIPYEALEYPDDLRDAEQIAEVLGIPPELVYKTLVVEPEGGSKPFLVMMASNRRLDLKKLAQVSGQKKVRMAAHKDAEALTGLKVGGISALALMQKQWTVYLDKPAADLEHILISGGQRGVQLRVPVRALIGLVRARIADMGREAQDGEAGEA
jgi:Cys-tRNA(Pro)/Cys-tRNA(Cys) deacylase